MEKGRLPVNALAGRAEMVTDKVRWMAENRRNLRGRAGRMRGGRGSGRASTGQVRLWGRHAVEAALRNPERQHHKLWATREGLASLEGDLPADFPVEHAQGLDLARLVPSDTSHQGLVLDCAALAEMHLADVLAKAGGQPLVVLDQVTDPQNLGAIMRSAAAFGAAALVTQDRHAPPESGTVAKAASGALELLPWVRVVNLARALEEMADRNYWRIGLAGDGTHTFADAVTAGPIALVLGAEGEGLRHNVAAHCDVLAHLPISDTVESLNVSATAAIALYALRHHAQE